MFVLSFFGVVVVVVMYVCVVVACCLLLVVVTATFIDFTHEIYDTRLGNVPTEIGLLTSSLNSLWLENNQLSGLLFCCSMLLCLVL